ncbi:MAG: hypothetical protein F4X20_02735 [Dehalococcoidia bacterium]|nr:hypothetical protein [Dehalococcoidia bacterium]
MGLLLEPGEMCAYSDDVQSDFVLAVRDDGSTYLDGDVGPLSLSEKISDPGVKVCACGLETEWDGTGRTITALPEPLQIVDTSGIEKPREPFRENCAVGMRLLPGELCRYPQTGCLFAVSLNGEGQFIGRRNFSEIAVNDLRLAHVTIDFSASVSDNRWIINEAPPPEATPSSYAIVSCVVSSEVAELHTAIESHDSATVRRLLAEGVDVNGRSVHGNPPLWTALVQADDAEITRLLLDAGADVEARDWHGNPLTHAVAYEDSLAQIKLLIDVGADLNARSGDGDTLLGTASIARNLELMSFLLELGADPNERGREGWPVLARILFSEDGDTESAALLLQAGADVNVRFADGTPVGEVAMRPWASDEMLSFLLAAGLDIHALDSQENPTWWRALRPDTTSKLRILLDAGADPDACNSRGDPALRQAIHLGNAEAIPMLLDAGANPSALTANGDPLLAFALVRSQMSAIPLLVEGGADVNARDSRGSTVLELARLVGSEEIVQYLIDAGAG